LESPGTRTDLVPSHAPGEIVTPTQNFTETKNLRRLVRKQGFSGVILGFKRQSFPNLPLANLQACQGTKIRICSQKQYLNSFRLFDILKLWEAVHLKLFQKGKHGK
jgi:hypothetical protein